ncbi:hypothetical protein [Streptomyces sp. NBC_01506]|uniref:hypothetical protein n=1 Tax=Streptomyces sp. NBC_01506 TaxID=2903887 RepID=UPI00386DA01C
MSRRKVPYGLTFDQNGAVRPRRFGEDLLHEQRVDVYERGLRQVQREHLGLGVLLVRPGESAVLA